MRSEKIHPLFALLCLLLVSCNKPKLIDANDIMGTWTCSEPAAHNDYNIGRIEFNDSNDIWIDPLCDDTIYHYHRYAFHGDSLMLYDCNDKEFVLRLEYLKRDSLVLSATSFFARGITFRKESGTALPPIKHMEAKNIPPDSLDIIVKGTAMTQLQADGDRQYVILSKDNMLKAKAILKHHMDSCTHQESQSNRRALPFNQYIRQYSACLQDGHLKVYVSLMAHVHFFSSSPHSWYFNLMKQEYIVDDGGRYYADALIDLTEDRVEWFYVHGEA